MSIQRASEVDTLVFDLNGTLTKGKPQIQKIKSLDAQNQLSEDDILEYLFALEHHSEHPIAKAICARAKQKRQQRTVQRPSLITSDVDQSHHAGISATIDKQVYTVGNSDRMEALGIDMTAYASVLQSDEAEHVVFLAREKNHCFGHLA